jgi:hypothetical protein
MKRTQGLTLAPLALLCAVILYLAPAGWAQTVELQIQNPPSNNVLDDIYVGSYSANYVTPSGLGASLQITCDDFKDNSNFESATYNVNTFSTLGNTLWGSYLGVGTATTMYEEAAWLTLGMLGQTGTQQGYYSYAIWAIFDPGDVATWFTNHLDVNACNAVFGTGSWTGSASAGTCTASTTNKGGLVELAMSMAPSLSPSQFSNILILTPQGCANPGTCKEQEFLEVVAEGGTTAIYLLLAGLACFGAMFFRSRLQAPATPV